MGPQLVAGQAASNSVSGTSCAVTINGVTAGNMLVAVAATDDATVPGATAITDTKGNTWERDTTKVGVDGGPGNNGSVGIFKARNVAAGNTQVTFTNGTAFIALSVGECTPNGLQTTDGTNGATSATATTVNPGNISTANADDLLVAGGTDAIATVTWSTGSGYTLGSCINSNANTNVGMQFQGVASTSNYSTAFGNTATNGWTGAAVAIKSAGAAAAGATTLPAAGLSPTPKIAAQGWLSRENVGGENVRDTRLTNVRRAVGRLLRRVSGVDSGIAPVCGAALAR